jgi:hypothetical protein
VPDLPPNAGCRQLVSIGATDNPAVYPESATIEGDTATIRFKLWNTSMVSSREPSPQPFAGSYVFLALDKEPAWFIDVSSYANPWSFDLALRGLPKGQHHLAVGWALNGQLWRRSFFQVCFTTPANRAISDFEPIR